MTTNKPEVFEVYRTRQGTLENVVLLADYEDLQAECVALSASVVRLREGLEQALVHWGAHLTDGDGIAYAECERRCDETYATSFARLKAEWQAEAMQATADAIRYEYEGEVHRDRIADYADAMADELRRQGIGG